MDKPKLSKKEALKKIQMDLPTASEINQKLTEAEELIKQLNNQLDNLNKFKREV